MRHGCARHRRRGSRHTARRRRPHGRRRHRIMVRKMMVDEGVCFFLSQRGGRGGWVNSVGFFGFFFFSILGFRQRASRPSHRCPLDKKNQERAHLSWFGIHVNDAHSTSGVDAVSVVGFARARALADPIAMRAAAAASASSSSDASSSYPASACCRQGCLSAPQI